MRPRLIAALLALAAGLGLTAAAGGLARGSASPSSPRFVDEIDNAYFPLEPGTRYVYRGSREGRPTRDVVTVTRRTIAIQGVTCTVVHDDLYVDGRLLETTDDYYAQDRRGNVHYFGEDTEELDEHGHVTSTEGSWKAGVQGARAGIIMLDDPRVGRSYREELFKGHAEDRAEVLTLSASVSVPFGTFHDALKTRNTTPLEPDVVEHKVYAKGVGLVHEQDVSGGSESSDLVSETPHERG